MGKVEIVLEWQNGENIEIKEMPNIYDIIVIRMGFL